MAEIDDETFEGFCAAYRSGLASYGDVPGTSMRQQPLLVLRDDGVV